MTDMAADWSPVERSRTYELVIDRIEQQILDGTLRVGDRLPAERELAPMLGVSRSAVREAIRSLEAQGVLTSAVGAGPAGGTIVSGMPGQALTRLLRLHVALANFPMADVVEARVMLERLSARLAATHATPAQLKAMEMTLDSMDDASIDKETFNQMDTQFHVAVAEAAGNRLVADMTIAIRDSMHLPLLRAYAEVTDWDSLASQLRAQHRAVLKAIREHNAREASDLVEQHITSAYKGLPALHGQASAGTFTA